jgi:hypothetical protein
VNVGDEYFVAGVNTLVSLEDLEMGEYGTFAFGIAIPGVSDWIAYTMASVPEPSGVALALGLAVLPPLLVRRRRRR